MLPNAPRLTLAHGSCLTRLTLPERSAMNFMSTPSPRVGRQLLGLVLAASAAMPWVVQADVTSPVLAINDEVSNGPVTVQRLRGNVSVLIGSGGNISVLSAPEGKLLIDAGIAVSKAKLESALGGIGPGPVKFVINTHYHWDHSDGNAWLHDAGATVVAHDNTLKRLKQGTRVIDWGFTFQPVPVSGLPGVTFQGDKTITFGNETVILKYRGTGHTDTDVTAYFQKADILAVGDIWWNGYYPFIDYSAGGSIDGVIRQVDDCIRASTGRTIIVPGHGDVSDRKTLIEFRDMLVAVRKSVATLKHQGRTLAETVAARPTAPYDAKFGRFLIDPAFFTHLVYMGV
jgi:glyoxylase-like metal-dependent hydrolase (beta-lactamase superfamily II)